MSALVATVCVSLLVLTTVLHYEVLRLLTAALPRLEIPIRMKLLVVIFAAFVAHTAEIVLYALAIYALIRYFDAGALTDGEHELLAQALYFSAENYTSLGYGDVVATGDMRWFSGVESLNGLLLIGWSASYTHVAMDRFWREAAGGTPQIEADGDDVRRSQAPG